VEGILVTGVLEDGPASQAGLRPGDVITEINGALASNSHELMQLIANEAPGSAFEVRGWRGNEPFTFVAVSGQRPSDKD
jgi:S1-C subfamily serine protease